MEAQANGTQARKAQADECVTDLLRKWNEGNDQAFAQLIPLIYSELRERARQLLRNERPNQTMQTAAREAGARPC